jgi:hypothetical protein
MTIAISKKTRLARLEASRAVVSVAPLADRLRAARLNHDPRTARTPAELVQHYEALTRENPRSMLAARLLRAAVRMAKGA